MATTTPNFGWSVPTSSDLVKNGAVAIETLGDSIDASLVDLKGGTTGQVLAKASGTDMDFAWVSDATGMTNPMTTTGDVIYSSSGSTPARLGIGTAGQVLQVNSGATAPEWATPAGGGKVLQVVQATTSTQVINSTSTLADTGLTASITPSSATSKVLVLVSQMGCMKTAAASTNAINLRLFRGATDIAKIAGYGLDTGTSLQQMASFTYSYLDSPATTSSTTYKTQFSNINNGASVRVQQETELSTIILMEIGA